MQYTFYMTLAPLATVVSMAVIIYIWRYRTAPGAGALIGQIIAVSGWLIFNTLELADPTEAGTIFWAKATYLGSASAPVMWWAFALHYSDRHEWLRPPHFIPLCIIPLITNVLVQTNEWHHLIWQNYRFVPINNLLAMNVSVYGSWFWVHFIYNYTLVLFGAYFISKEYFNSFKLYRRRSTWLIIGAISPLIVHIIYTFNLIPGFRKDYSPIAFAFAEVSFAIAILRYHLFNLRPVARDAQIESMSDGMLVLDEKNRVVDLNPAAQKIIGFSKNEVIGQSATQLLSRWPNLIEQFRTATDVHTEIFTTQNGTSHHYDLQVSLLTNRQGRLTGRLIALRDITERKRAEEEREHLITQLEAALAQVKTLSGLLPICAHCKKIRDDQGYWHQVEIYIRDHSEVEFSHGICPDCARELYPDYFR